MNILYLFPPSEVYSYFVSFTLKTVCQGISGSIGLIVDAATEVKDIEQNQIQAAPKLVAGIHETFLKGVAKVDNHLLILLDLERIVDLNESNELREAIMRES